MVGVCKVASNRVTCFIDLVGVLTLALPFDTTKAINYMLNQWQALILLLREPRCGDRKQHRQKCIACDQFGTKEFFIRRCRQRRCSVFPDWLVQARGRRARGIPAPCVCSVDTIDLRLVRLGQRPDAHKGRCQPPMKRRRCSHSGRALAENMRAAFSRPRRGSSLRQSAVEESHRLQSSASHSLCRS
jgi:hypothetical protein